MNFVRGRKSFFGINKRFSQIFYTLLSSVILLLLAENADSFFNISALLADNNIWHRILDFFILIISFSIFIVAYYTYPQTKDNRLLIVGYIFLTGGILYWIKILDIFNYLNFQSKLNISCNMFILCILFRFLNASCFSFLATVKFKNKFLLNRLYLLAGTVVTIFISILIICTPSINRWFFVSDEGMSIAGIVITAFSSLLYIYTFYNTLREYERSNDFVLKILSCGFIIMFFSEITFLSVKQAYDMRSVLSQFYLVASYCILFYSFYIYSIRRPYILLSKANKKLDKYLAKMDKLVDTRTRELRGMYEKLMADQEIARGIQLSMLPRELPNNEYVEFSSGYVPAEELSGDFYNVIKIDETRYGICMGDVSGHGVSAAMLSIFAFQKMQSLMEETSGEGMAIPSIVLQHLYDSFNASNFNDDMYIVMLYGVFNIQTGILSYSSGGLNTIPLRIRPDGSIQELDNDGFAICKLGSLLKPKFVNYQILLFPGDKLVLYTDGLVDARNSHNEEYSLGRLKKAITNNSKYGIKYLTEAIIRDVKEFAGDKLSDDITLLALDVLPPF